MAQINKSSEYFNTVLYTGNTTVRSITGVGFQPDLVVIKDRDTVIAHYYFDVVRGVYNKIHSNLTNAETSDSNTLTSFDSDGFSLGVDGAVNGSGKNVVAWNWLAGGTGVSNTDGSITSTVSASTTSGFSIVSYTSDGNSGATVGHGLGVAPSVVIVKRRSSAEDWGVGHQSLGWTNFLRLNTTGASSASTGLWNDTAPSSTVVTLGNSGISNVGSGTTMIMYCFAPKKGFSAMGQYTGNGSSDGTFVYTGFKPAMIIIKRTDAVKSWIIIDNARDTYNPQTKMLFPNASDVEYDGTSAQPVDKLSNGFKIRNADANYNASGGTYIYMAFAENPLVGTNNVPATAR